MILSLQQGLAQDGFKVSLVKLCHWFEMPRRTVYYRSTKAPPKVQEHFVKPIKAMIEENPSFGYRTVAHLLGFNKNTVQRVFQLKGWQVRKRPVGFRHRIQALPSVAKAPDERWATDLCRVWTGRDGWASLALVIDCYSRELLGWHLSRSGRSKTAEAGVDCQVRLSGQGPAPVPVEVRQRSGVHQPQLHGLGQKLWPAAGVHHPVQPGAKRHGRARDQNAQRPMRAPPPLRDTAARQSCDRRLDRLL